MRTRTAKWARYRKKILATPDEKFDGYHSVKIEEVDKVQGKIQTPYEIVRKKQANILIIKSVLTVIAIVALVLLYVLWVK